MKPIEEFIRQAESNTSCWDGNNTFYNVYLKGDNVIIGQQKIHLDQLKFALRYDPNNGSFSATQFFPLSENGILIFGKYISALPGATEF